jgi:hypothetical protein
MAVDERLAAKGRNEPLVGLRDQGGYTSQLAKQFATELAQVGWTGADQSQFESMLIKLEAERAEQAELRDQSKKNLEAEGAARADAKRFKYRLDQAVSDLFARAAYDATFNVPATQKAFQTGPLGSLNKSTPKVITYLSEVRPHVNTIKQQLAPYFGGADVVALLDGLLLPLKTAQVAQEMGVASLPSETQEVYEQKGKLLLTIERVNRLGRIAFAGDAVKIAAFNKDILGRARKARKSAAPAEPAAVGP